MSRMLNILHIHLPANHMDDKLFTNIYTQGIQQCLQHNMQWKRLKKWQTAHWYLQRAPTYSVLSAPDFLANNNMTFVQHTPSTNL